jgi:hypothetical protein
MDALRFGVHTSDISLKQLLDLPCHECRSIVEEGSYIDIYFGDTRVYKCTSGTLLFASCPDIGRYLMTMHGCLAVCLPEGLSNVLAAKLAVLCMEQYLLSPIVRHAPWKVSDDFASYIYFAKLFAFVGMLQAARELEAAIFRGLRERPLNIEKIRGIRGRENAQHPSLYAEVMADNIFTFTCVAKIELLLVEYDVEPARTYKERIKEDLQKRGDTSSKPAG